MIRARITLGKRGMSDVFEDAPADASLADPLPGDPFQILSRWFDEARRTSLHNPGAVIVSTVDAHGNARARTVLCRGIEGDRGALVFYTNRNSAKGRHLAARPRASIVFYWDPLARQVCASGSVELTTEAESDTYWATRPRLSQIAARVSRQSEPIESRAALLARIEAEATRYGGVDGTAPIPRPTHWGGYRIVVERIELWVGSTGRAHDRVVWVRDAEGAAWRHNRLQP
jgi:pyridoxamine 5'-phosphate oxidase